MSVSSLNTSEDWFQQLMALRVMTKTTGIIHDAQALQLRLWPKVVFGDKAKVEATVSADIGGGGKALFKVKRPARGKLPVPTKDGAKLLASWVRALLGDEWEVQIDVNGERFVG